MVRKMTKESGYSLKEIYDLFPSGPAKGACKVAGLPKPTGCGWFISHIGSKPGCISRVFLYQIPAGDTEQTETEYIIDLRIYIAVINTLALKGGSAVNTNDLKYYLAICQEKSFAQAAKNLFFTQQGVGMII